VTETERPGDRVGHGSGLQAALRREEYTERDQLQAEAGGQGGLIRFGRVTSAVTLPQGDNEAREALQAEGRAHVEDAEGGVGAAGHLLGELRTVVAFSTR
jgi:hypothetical protein